MSSKYKHTLHNKNLPIIIGVFATGGILMTAAIVGISFRYLTKRREDKRDKPTLNDSSSSSSRDDENAVVSTKRFHWEPSGIDDGTVASNDDHQRTSSSRPSPKNSSSAVAGNNNNSNCVIADTAYSQQQLHFLSQMTFANGGIRAPSCPCCF